MSVLISGALLNGAGIPMSGCHIILKSRVTTSEVVMRTVADVETGNNGEYSFEAQVGKYCVYLRQAWHDEYCVGDFSVYEDSKPGTLNDFLTALDEGDLKPDVVKRFEEMVAQAQQSAEAAAGSEQQAGQHLADVEQVKTRVGTLAEEVQQNTDAVAADRRRVGQLAQEVSDNAGQVQQGVQEATEAVKTAQEAAKKSAASAGESKACADSAAQSEQKAQQHAQTAGQHVQQSGLNLDATTTAKNEAAQSAASARKDAEATAADRTATAEDVKQSGQNAAASEQSAQDAKRYRDSAQQIVDGLNATNATTTQKGLVQLSSATDSDSEELAATPKAVKAVMDETQTKAPLDSPALTGTPTVPTPASSATGHEIANAAFVRLLIAALVDSVPESLDTLKELADALGNDPNFSTTVLNALAGKQPLNDVLTAISQLTERAGNLLYFDENENASLSALSEKARLLLAQVVPEDMRAVLELKSAATMEPQADIRDRTEGRLAIPGMYGFGRKFFRTETIKFKTADEFLAWAIKATPGRYSVEGGDKIIPRVGFNGVVEIIWPEGLSSNYSPTVTTKVVIFYGISGDIWFNRCWSGSYFIGWENLKLTITDVTQALYGTTDWTKGIPAVNGLILAAHQETNDEGDRRRLARGRGYRGSELGLVTIWATRGTGGVYTSSAQFVIENSNSHPLPGTYAALSGSMFAKPGDTEVSVGLFLRIA